MYKFGKTALTLLALAAMSFGVMTACDEGDQPHTGWEPTSSSSSLVTDSSSSVADADSSSVVDNSSESADVENSSSEDSSVEADSSIDDEPEENVTYMATNPDQLSGETVQVKMWNDGNYELIVEVNTPDGLARMTITGVWTEWEDGTIHFDALTAVQDYKGETTEDTSEDKKHWDVYGTLDRENGTFTITGKGSTPPGGNGTQGGDISTDDNGQGGNNGAQGDDGLADKDTPPSNNN